MFKRIVVLIDGTGNQPADRHSTDRETDVTNVYLLSEVLASSDIQRVAYFKGIATGGRPLGDWFSFNFGIGWNRKRDQARAFIRKEYELGDQLFLVGFSRGAAIVRDLANELSDESIPTHAMLLFDSVAAFGLPTRVPGIPQQFNLGKRLRIPTSTRHVHHAVALDELREPFAPTLCRHDQGLKLEEVWFAGDHADIGGGRKRRGLADLTLRWARARLAEHGLAFVRRMPPARVSGCSPDDIVRRTDFVRPLVRKVRCDPADAELRPRVHRSVETLIGEGYEPLALSLPLKDHYEVVDG